MGSVAKVGNGEGRPLIHPSLTACPRDGSSAIWVVFQWWISRRWGRDPDFRVCPLLWYTYAHGGQFQATKVSWHGGEKAESSEPVGASCTPRSAGVGGRSLTGPSWAGGPWFFGWLTALTKEAIRVMLCFKLGLSHGSHGPGPVHQKQGQSPLFSLPTANTDSSHL